LIFILMLTQYYTKCFPAKHSCDPGRVPYSYYLLEAVFDPTTTSIG
jgi:hypothetical protein